MDPAALLERGLAAQRAGNLTGAAVLYRQLLQQSPKHPDALYLLGLLLQKAGDHAGAIDLFSRATKANPKLGRAHLQRGFSLNTTSEPAAAMAAFQAAIAAEPGLAEAHHQLGNALRALKRWPEAQASLREATRRAPADQVFWLSRGVACLNGQQPAEAVECFQQAVKLNPLLPEAHEILGQALMAWHQNDEARKHFNEALRLRPSYSEAHHDLGRLAFEEGLLAEAAKHYRAAIAVKPAPETQTNLIFLLNYLPDADPTEHLAEHRRWSEWFEQPLRSQWQAHANNRDPNRRLRIGYVSPDLRDHPVTAFIEPVLRAHQCEQFETFCYANLQKPDAISQRLRALASQWRDICGMTPEQAAELVRRDGIDILVDLAGHTTDHSLLVFARKPAPVQVTWIGYPNTTGLEAMDYRLTDLISDPPAETERWHSEYLIRLPETFSCYSAPAETPAVAPLPASAKGFVTFGSFNNFRKLSEPAIALWARVLNQVSNSRLLIKSQGLGDPPTLARLRHQFVRAGVAAERIELHSANLSKAEHMGLYSQVDLCLDPFPYNGTTTTCDALWMGVPVITLAGRTHVARVGVSLVTHLGHPEWAVKTPDDYVAKCQELAADLPALANLRRGLREQMRQSPLCDAQRFIVHLEAAYRVMWSHWCQQLQP